MAICPAGPAGTEPREEWSLRSPRLDYPETLHGFLLQSAGRLGEDAAVLEYADPADIRPVSYRELEALADHYAHELRLLGLGVGDRVVLESETSSSGIAMLLACSSLGVAFVPVSPEIPDARFTAIIDAAEPSLVLRRTAREHVKIPAGAGIASFSDDAFKVDRCPKMTVARPRLPVPTDVAYIVFTSGTTGRPKGVVMSHRAIVAFYRAMLSERIVAEGERVVSTAPFHFDFALLDIGLALGSGATMVPTPRRLAWQPQKFVRFLGETRATQVNGVPSLWPPILHHAANELSELTHIRGILYSGEPFPLSALRSLRRSLPHARIVNCFGSTESVACSFTDVPRELGEGLTELPIGPPRAGAAMVLIGEHGEQVEAPGQIGEIYLHSPALFSGYWGDQGSTRRALVPDPFDHRSGQLVYRSGDLGRLDDRGRIFFCGRADQQVKIRGNRVELGEIESTIQGMPGVDEVAVLALPAGTDGLGLFAFVVSRQTGQAGVRTWCEASLPSYMVPYQIHVRSDLPRTANGKIDRRTLGESVAGSAR